jgi:cellulose synthase/poly-beta-1,6-N-acetylglucosamine synthase-like glycosyltransferase
VGRQPHAAEPGTVGSSSTPFAPAPPRRFASRGACLCCLCALFLPVAERSRHCFALWAVSQPSPASLMAAAAGDALIQLSVLLCVRNGERFLRAALDSVLQQRLSLAHCEPTAAADAAATTTATADAARPDPSIEFVLVDDASTDGTSAILREYAERGQWALTLARCTAQCPAACLGLVGLTLAGLEFTVRLPTCACICFCYQILACVCSPPACGAASVPV